MPIDYTQSPPLYTGNETTQKYFTPSPAVPAIPPSEAAALAVTYAPLELAAINAKNATVYTPNRARFTAAKLPKFLTALAATKAGTADTRILCLGDSTTAGFGSSDTSIPPNKSYPAALSALINTYLGVPSANGLGIPPRSGGPDARWTYNGNWTIATVGWGNDCCISLATPFAGSTTFSDTRVLADTFDVYYIRTASSGTITVTATGGTPVVVPTSNATATWGKVTVTAPVASTTNVVTITGTGGTCYVNGVEPRLSTTKKVLLGNAGVGSSRTAGWVLNNTTFGGVVGIQTYAPHLTIISLGINDATDGQVAATYATNIQTLATAAAISGDVILMSMIPTDSSINAGANSTNEPLYVAQLAGISAYAYVDVFTRAGSAVAYNNLGFVNADKIHGTDNGYKDIAQMVFSGLLGL